MKPSFCFSLVLLVSFLMGNAYADFTGKGHVHTIAITEQVFLNSECRSEDTCNLKRFTLKTSVDEVWFSDEPNNPTYGNGVIMEYETDSVDALENYAIVQFIKGCVFDSSKNAKGKITRNISYTTHSFGETIPLCFPEWVIDSQDTDPAYNSDPQYGRFYLLRWNRPGSYDSRTQTYYGAEKPTRPIVYMADNPDGAFVSATAVKNTALEFKTCIYKARDVPIQTRRNDTNFAKPISCFEWQNVYVYNFDQGRFESNLAAIPSPVWPQPNSAAYLLLIFLILFIALVLITVAGVRHVTQPATSLLIGLACAGMLGVFSILLGLQS